jgi:hypothetical protein
MVTFFVTNWGYIFKKRVVGEVFAVEKVTDTVLFAAGNANSSSDRVYSFSIGIKDSATGEIYMASTEDRQWAAVQKGNCVVAAYFPYPPWQFSKGNTYHNARLLRNFESCQKMPPMDGFLKKFLFLFLIS